MELQAVVVEWLKFEQVFGYTREEKEQADDEETVMMMATTTTTFKGEMVIIWFLLNF